MKKFSILGLVAMATITYAQQDTDAVSIPDVNFKNALLQDKRINTNKDGEISYAEARSCNTINIASYTTTEIQNLTGLEAFSNLKYLTIGGQKQLLSIDLGSLSNLTNINLDNNGLTSIILNSQLPELKLLSISGSQLSSISLENYPKLRDLRLMNNQLTNIELNNLPSLSTLQLSGNQLNRISIDNSIKPELRLINLSENQLQSIDLNDFPKLDRLVLDKNNLTSITLNSLPMLEELRLHDNKTLEELQLENLPKLRDIRLDGNGLRSLTLNNLSSLYFISANSNQLQNITLDNVPLLNSLSANDNQLTSIDLTKVTKLNSLALSNNQLTSIDLRRLLDLSYVELNNNRLSEINVANLRELSELKIEGNGTLNTYLDLSKNKYIATLEANGTRVPVVNMKGVPSYATVNIGDEVKCIEVRDVDRAKKYSWEIGWLNNEENYRTDCSEYRLSTNDISKTQKIRVIYPITNTLTLTDKVDKIEIYNTTGQLLKTLIGNHRDVSDLPTGMYIIKLSTSSGNTQTMKIVK